MSSAVEPLGPRGPQLILGTALGTLALLLFGRALLNSRPEPNPTNSDAQLQEERLWSTDPERRRLAALLLASRSDDQPQQRWRLLRNQGWGAGPLAPVAIKQQAQAGEQLGRVDEAEGLWQELALRFPDSAATADALYALGRKQPQLRQRLLARFPAHPAALAAALEQATDADQTPARRQAGALHLARSGPRWGGARAVLLRQCRLARGTGGASIRQVLALGLARLGDGAESRRCLDQPTSSLSKAADTLLLGEGLLQGADAGDPGLAAEGRATLLSLLRRWPEARETDAALRVLAEDPSRAGLETLKALPDRWRSRPPVQARLALEGLADGFRVLERWPDDPASWELRWQLARRALLQQRWQLARSLLTLPPGSALPAPLAARQRFWLGYSLDRLGRSREARALWRDQLRQDNGGYYGWRASVRLGEAGLRARIGEAEASAILDRLERRPWAPLNSRDPELERLWQAGLTLEAWELWRHRRRGETPQRGDDLRIEGLLRQGVGDDGHGLEQLERASLRLVKPSCELHDHLQQALHPVRFAPAFRRAAADSGINPALLLGVAKAESSFLPAARSPVGAIGLLQLMPETARDVAGEPLSDWVLTDPERNSKLGARYLQQLLQQWNGALVPAVASYNAGAGAVSRWDRSLLQRQPELWVEQIPYPETRLYVKKVLGNAWSYQRGGRSDCGP